MKLLIKPLNDEKYQIPFRQNGSFKLIMPKSSHLTKFVLDNTPRMIGWIDRRKGSPTYGCSDRNYWHYKIVDFPCAMLQETALTLALLYSENFEYNQYYKSKFLRELVIKKWKKLIK